MVHSQGIMKDQQLKWRDGKMSPREGQGEGRPTWRDRRTEP